MAPMNTGEVEQQSPNLPTKPSKWYFRTACSINGDDFAPKITFLYLCSSISPRLTSVDFKMSKKRSHYGRWSRMQEHLQLNWT